MLTTAPAPRPPRFARVRRFWRLHRWTVADRLTSPAAVLSVLAATFLITVVALLPSVLVIGGCSAALPSAAPTAPDRGCVMFCDASAAATAPEAARPSTANTAIGVVLDFAAAH